MIGPEILTVFGVAVAALIVSAVWYSVQGDAYGAALRSHRSAPLPPEGDRPPAWKVGVEIVRSVVVATALAIVANEMGLDRPGQGVLLGLAAWVAFPGVLLLGSVIWDGVPVRLALIHGGDWVVKLVLMGAAAAAWT